MPPPPGPPLLSTVKSAAAAASSSPARCHRGRPLRYAVLGAGFAGLSVAWHLLKHSPKGSRVSVDIYDENGVGGGASGVSGGLLHPYSPKVKLLWRGAEFWKECMDLLHSAEQANGSDVTSQDEALIWRRGILRPPTTEKAAEILLEALLLACQNMADEASISPNEQKEFKLYKEHIDNLQKLPGDYDSVIICLGGKASSLPELTNKLPLRTCRGVIAEFQLPSDAVEKYGSQSPSILSDAWLAFQGSRNVSIGSTWQWKSENYAPAVSNEEALTALEELLPKASAVYPGIVKWDYVRSRAGIRAMPPLTANGSLPLLGCLNDVFGDRSNCLFWLIGGLGARGLLYHGLVGKLTAKAVISCDENLIPPEFTCWKMIKALQ